MYWQDEGYLLSKNNFNENSIIIEAFTLNHGKYSGIVYGGSSKKKKKLIQIGNKFLLNLRSKNVNQIGYFDVELINPIAPLFFDDKKRSICILAATSILKTLLPERQINKMIYNKFENLLNNLKLPEWIFLYISWELSLIKELGFELNFHKGKIPNDSANLLTLNDKSFKIPNFLLKKEDIYNLSQTEIKEALIFNKNIFLENFIIPNRLRFPLSRNLLEKYY
jgi:DNA repair protein RecO (recombination protein O)